MSDSSFGRLVGVLGSPARTFEAIDRRPTWVVALVVVIVAAIGLGVAVHQRTDYRELMEHGLAKSNAELTGPQIDRVVDMQERFGAFFAVLGGTVGAGIMVVIALVLWVLLHLFGSEIDFQRSLAVLVHANMPSVLMMLIAIPLVLSGGTLSFEQLATRNFLASNLAFLAPADAGMAVRSALAGVDFFGLWSVLLMAIGYRRIGKVSPAVAWGVVLLVWVAGLALRVGVTVLSGGGGR